jgi:hypothetical protein
MSSDGTGVPMEPTPQSHATLAHSVGAGSWKERYKSGNPVLRPSVSSFSSLCCAIGVGLRIG